MKICRNCNVKFTDSFEVCPRCGSENFDMIQVAHPLARLGAALIDSLVLSLVGIFHLFNLAYFRSVPFLIIASIPYFIYRPLMHYFYGATLGKMALAISVRTVHNERLVLSQAFVRSIFFMTGYLPGLLAQYYLIKSVIPQKIQGMMEFLEFLKEPVSFPESIINFGNISTMILLSVLSFIIFNPARQGVHDIIARTFVVKNK